MIYLIGTLLSMIIAKYAYNNINPFEKKTKGQVILAILSALPFIVLAGFRYNVGCDFASYARYFDNFEYMSIHKMEFGFNLLIQIIKFFTNNNLWFFIVSAGIFIFFVYKAIYEQSVNPVLSIFLLFSTTYFTTYLNGMRQLMAISIFLYAIKYIRDRKFFKYLFFISISCALHTSSIIYIPVYFLYNVKIKPKYQILILTLCFILKNTLFEILNSLFLLSKYSVYNEVFAVRDANNILIILEITTLLFALIFYKKTSDRYSERDYNFFCILKLIAAIISIFDGAIPIIGRLRWNFGLPIIIFIPMILDKIENKKIRFLIELSICVLYLIYVFVSIEINDSHCVLPYQLNL